MLSNKKETKYDKISLLKINKFIKKSILLNKQSIIVDNKINLKKIIKDALKDGTTNNKIFLGVVSNKTIIKIKNEISNIKKSKIKELFKENLNFTLMINEQEIRHIKKKKITEEDVINYILNIPKIINEFDEVSYSVYCNQNALRFKKN